MNSKTIAIIIGTLIVVGSATFLTSTKKDGSISKDRSLDSKEVSIETLVTSLEETTVPTTTEEVEITEVTTDTALETITQSTTVATTEPTTTTSVTTTAMTEATTTEETTTTVFQPTKITANGVTVETVSVSCLKVEWEAEEGRSYTVTCLGYGNPYFSSKDNNVCYITGLREGSEYNITVTPTLFENENPNDYECVTTEAVGYTESVEVIQEFPREDGWTSCFAFEKASGLTRQPSSGAIYGSKVDEITNTGIRRFENGDYCCAMGLWYGTVGDRFLVELENGQQFTVRICDSKGWCDDADGDGIGDGRFHWFDSGHTGKCIIEFIYDDGNLPSCVAYSGSYGYYSWEGLDLCSNILSIKKINY